MENSKYVTIDFILDKVFRDNGYDLELSYADAIEWVGEVHGLVGAPMAYSTRITNGENGNLPPLEIVDFKAELPCDFHMCIQARDYEHKYPMVYATNTYHTSYIDNSSTDLYSQSTLTYGLDANYIWTSFQTGQVELAYKAFPVDDKGLPKIPDNQKYIEAVAAYIRTKIDYKLWRQGKIKAEIYSHSQQVWRLYVAAAKTSLQIPSIDKMEGLKNQYLRLIPSINEHNYSFRYQNLQEQMKVRNNYNNATY